MGVVRLTLGLGLSLMLALSADSADGFLFLGAILMRGAAAAACRQIGPVPSAADAMSVRIYG